MSWVSLGSRPEGTMAEQIAARTERKRTALDRLCFNPGSVQAPWMLLLDVCPARLLAPSCVTPIRMCAAAT